VYTPFDYQKQCLHSLEQTWKSERDSALIVMASGLGKTVTAAFDLQNRLEEDVSRALYVCHRTDILYQAKSEFENVIGEEISYGFLTGEEKDLYEKHLLFASFQTMRDYKELYRRKEFDYIVVDESHRSYAPTYKQTLDYFSPEYLLGMTATPQRGDGQDIEEIYGPAVFELGLASAINRGLVCSVDYRLLTDNIDFDELLEASEEKVSRAELNRRIFIPRRDEEVAQIITQRMEEIEYPQNIVFCPSIEHCNRMSELLPESLPLHSEVPRNERTVRLELFRQGLIRTIVAVDCLNEGVDIPRANVVVFLRSTSTPRIFLQQLGRGLRRVEGKDRVVVLDFASNFERIQMAYNLWKKAQEHENNSDEPDSEDEENGSVMTLEVAGVTFQESEKNVDALLSVLNQVGKYHQFYETLEEASAAAQELGIETSQEYHKVAPSKDPLLPARPQGYYSESWSGWYDFLGKERDPRQYYETCEESAEAARSLGVTSQREYVEEAYPNDRRLPYKPDEFYAESWPGWEEFLDTKMYESWEKAAKAARSFGVTTQEEYVEEAYPKDERLPRDPHDKYADRWPGWYKFLGKRDPNQYYNSYQEAKSAVRKIGVSTRKEYRKKAYPKDRRLPVRPDTFYSNSWNGWREFLGEE